MNVVWQLPIIILKTIRPHTVQAVFQQLRITHDAVKPLQILWTRIQLVCHTFAEESAVYSLLNFSSQWQNVMLACSSTQSIFRLQNIPHMLLSSLRPIMTVSLMATEQFTKYCREHKQASANLPQPHYICCCPGNCYTVISG
jgi:hypothetical protein